MLRHLNGTISASSRYDGAPVSLVPWQSRGISGMLQTSVLVPEIRGPGNLARAIVSFAMGAICRHWHRQLATLKLAGTKPSFRAVSLASQLSSSVLGPGRSCPCPRAPGLPLSGTARGPAASHWQWPPGAGSRPGPGASSRGRCPLRLPPRQCRPGRVSLAGWFQCSVPVTVGCGDPSTRGVQADSDFKFPAASVAPWST